MTAPLYPFNRTSTEPKSLALQYKQEATESSHPTQTKQQHTYLIE